MACCTRAIWPRLMKTATSTSSIARPISSRAYGIRVSSQQIENCIVELPEVVTAAVIGEPDLVRGEAIKAFVVLRAGAQLTANDILAHCAGRLANYMVPKEVVFIDHLPINAHGKIMKTELRKLSAPSEAVVA